MNLYHLNGAQNLGLNSHMKIYQATHADLETLHDLGTTTYRQHFADLWSEQGIQKFLDQDFSVERLQLSLSDPKQIWLLAENPRGQKIGYAKVNLNQFESHLNRIAIELQKIYFIREAVGQNFATILMHHIIDLARQQQHRAIFLEVLKTNLRAQKFYQNFGFQQKLSLDYQTDLYDIGMNLMLLDQ